MARAKLLLAVRGPRKRGIAGSMRANRRPSLVPAYDAPITSAPSVAASAAA
jgi:hypothetical protein